jgi:dienelactone hydrolase
MRSLAALIAALALMVVTNAAHPAPPPTPQLVDVPNGGLHLKGLLWVPAGCRHCPAILFNHGRPDTADQHVREGSAQRLGPVFARHGYVFLFLYRRGEGLSADQGPFISDLLHREERRHGPLGRDRLQVLLLETDHLSDGMAGIAFLRRQPQVDARRVAAVGHSFGGQLALLEAERDPSLRAAVAFGPAAGSWETSPLLRRRLIDAARAIRPPVLILHAANDYSTQPGKVLDAERGRAGKQHALKIYPPFGPTAAEGHSFLYPAPSIWEADVFRFLDRVLKT